MIAVGHELCRADGTAMIGEHAQTGGSDGIPQARRLIDAAGKQALFIRLKRRINDSLFMTEELDGLLLGLEVQDDHLLFVCHHGFFRAAP